MTARILGIQRGLIFREAGIDASSDPRTERLGKRVVAASDAVILEAEFAHLDGVVDVASVEEDGLSHDGFESFEVELPEFVPLGDEDEGIDSFGGFVGAFHVGDVGEDAFGVFDGDGVEGLDLGAFGEEGGSAITF